MKKRGLILSTIVMVVVLAVAITTATYAWFSSTASITVDNVNIKAQAVDGLEIAVKTSDTATYSSGYTNGTMAYTSGVWASSEVKNGFGTNLDFTNVDIGTIDNAVTVSDGTMKYFALKDLSLLNDGVDAIGAEYYTIDGEGLPKALLDTATYDAGVRYYEELTAAEGIYLVPTGYNSDVQPLGYFLATANAEYYDIPFAIRATTNDITAIVCTISVDDLGVNDGLYAPGMAAAVRIRITTSAGTYLWAPYLNTVYGTAGMTGIVAAEGKLSFILAYGNIAASNITDFNVKIWVEGTDPECNNATSAYTDFNVNFTFDYTKTTDLITIGDTSDASWTKLEINSVNYLKTTCTKEYV